MQLYTVSDTRMANVMTCTYLRCYLHHSCRRSRRCRHHQNKFNRYFFLLYHWLGGPVYFWKIHESFHHIWGHEGLFSILCMKVHNMTNSQSLIFINALRFQTIAKSLSSNTAWQLFFLGQKVLWQKVLRAPRTSTALLTTVPDRRWWTFLLVHKNAFW